MSERRRLTLKGGILYNEEPGGGRSSHAHIPLLHIELNVQIKD